MRKWIPILMTLASSSAFAVQVNFSFNVSSSGPSIYPCDAGIRHISHTEEICYDRTTQNSCNPQDCSDGQECSCVCTGGNDPTDTDYSQDFFNVSYADWADNGSPMPTVSTTGITATNDLFARIFANKDEWGKQITALSFNLGSERYGAEFYLDVCYRGPQINYAGNGASNKFAMNAQSTVTDLISGNGLSYSTLADLKVKVTATCDLQGVGDYTGPATDDATFHQITGVTGGDKSFSTSYTSFGAGANLSLVKDWINNSNSQSPRFCKIRYSFIENMRNNASDLQSQIRRWKLQEARISTFSDISSKKEL